MNIKIGIEKEFEVVSAFSDSISVEEIESLLKYFCNLTSETRQKVLCMISGAYMFEEPSEAKRKMVIDDFFAKIKPLA